MTVSLKHQFVSNVADSPDATLVQPSNWNAEHTLTANANSLLGAVTAGNVTEITCTSAGRALLDDADASAQRTTLGLGTISTQNSNNVSITGGSITGITDLAVADGGTGASDAATARTNLGIGTLGTQNANAVAITGGTIVANASGISIRDADASNVMTIAVGSNLTANTTLTLTTGATTNRTLDISATNVTVSVAGAALIDDADAAAQRTTLGLGTIATQNANNVSITGGSITGITDLAVADGGTGASDAATARTNLGIGTIATQNANNVSITGGSITGITDLAVADGGTGASDAATARTNLGIGTIATQNANNVSITGGSITGITDLAVADGGTGASDAATARTNLGIGTMGTQNANAVAITGGTIVANASGISIRDADASNVMTIAVGSNLTANTTLTLTTGATTNRTLDISATNVTISTAGAALIDDADAAAQRATLGLGTISTQNSDAVAITGGTIVANASGISIRDADASNVMTIAVGSNLTANTTLTLTTGATTSRTLDISATNVTVSVAGAALIDDADAAAQRTTLGLGTIATQNSNNVSITGGSITGITDLAVADGGTGASTAAAAATNLGLGTTDSPQFAAVNVGNATDTTITRVSAGVIAVEGKTVVTETGGQTVQFAAGSNTAPSITTTGNTNTGIFFPAANTTAITTGGTERMRIDTSGNVGIGTTSPDTKFQVSGTSGSTQFRAGTDTNGYFEINAFDTNPVYCVVGGTNATAGVFGTQSNIPTILFSNNTERVRIDTSGNVGIGTSSPDQILTINSANTTTNSLVSYMQGGTNYGYTGLGQDNRMRMQASVDIEVKATGSNYVALSTANTERFRAGPSGQFGIGGANYGTSGQVLTSGGASAAPSWSTLQGITATTGSPAYYGARAWVNFNGQGTLAINASVNISSITDNGTGDYTVNFTTAMPDANWAASAFSVAYANDDTRGGLVAYQPTGTATFIPLTKTSSAGRIINGRTSGAVVDDSADMSFVVYR